MSRFEIVIKIMIIATILKLTYPVMEFNLWFVSLGLLLTALAIILDFTMLVEIYRELREPEGVKAFYREYHRALAEDDLFAAYRARLRNPPTPSSDSSSDAENSFEDAREELNNN